MSSLPTWYLLVFAPLAGIAKMPAFFSPEQDRASALVIPAQMRASGRVFFSHIVEVVAPVEAPAGNMG